MTGEITNRPRQPGFETRAVHAGAPPDPTTGARNVPIYHSTAYVFDDVEHAASLFDLSTFGYIYSRLTNPTVAALEERIASLEDGRGATCTASGHAAQLVAFFSLMAPGDEFIASNRLYGGSITQFGRSFPKFGWTAHFVDADDPENLRRALTPRCKAIFVESLANPGGVVTDIEAAAKIAHEAGIPLIVDNTMASPYLCQPFQWGADIVVHSTTKFLGGHGNSMGGAIVDSGKFDWAQNDKFPALTRPEPAYHGLTFYETFGDMGLIMHSKAVGLRDLGPTMSPTNAFLTLTGIETLPLRMERHVANAQAVAEHLEAHEQVAWVSYAGLKSSPYRVLAHKYLPKGAGSVFTFGVKGGYEAGVKLVEACELFSHLANLGDTRSLILHPASTTHRQLSDEQRAAAGAGPDVVRLSIGIETLDDIIADLDQALAAAGR
jgi:O-acetylhomoserine (thiol)-lyase